MTNKPMLSVERDLLERVAHYWDGDRGTGIRPVLLDLINQYLSMPAAQHQAETVTKYAETVPKFKFETLVEHCKRLEADLAQSRAHVNEVTLYQQNAVWFWQHDGKDYLESLSCPIIIQPHHLRELIACAPEVRDTLYRSELKKEQEGFNTRIKNITESCATEFIAYKASFTYSSDQATNCAGCGKHKHTPLRVDPMGGYVCLTCIYQRLDGLLAEDSAREVEKDWDGCQEVADLPAVHEALKAFSGDSTGDAGVMVVKAIILAIQKPADSTGN